nr:MAG TPA: hypothetical protein [Caudoviricetes sp.]
MLNEAELQPLGHFPTRSPNEEIVSKISIQRIEKMYYQCSVQSKSVLNNFIL